MKIKFTKDHSPRKKGDVVSFETRDEIRTAEWYLANGMAERCKCSAAPSGCPDCEEKAEKASNVKVELTDEEKLAKAEAKSTLALKKKVAKK